MFNAVRLDKASMQIISQIRGMIFEGKLMPGDRLPSEAALMEQFQVGKQTLKEALRALEYMGLLQIRKGVTGGAFVVEMDREVMREMLASFLFFKDVTVHNLSEIRKVVEPYTTRVATERASAADLEKLASLVDPERQGSARYDSAASRSDMEFHRTIASLAGNPMLELVVDFVETVMVDLKKVIKPGGEFSTAVLEAHQRILAAMGERDCDRAAEEMYRHLVEVEENLSELEARTGVWNPLRSRSGTVGADRQQVPGGE